jgi:hypothetical protein
MQRLFFSATITLVAHVTMCRVSARSPRRRVARLLPVVVLPLIGFVSGCGGKSGQLSPEQIVSPSMCRWRQRAGRHPTRQGDHPRSPAARSPRGPDRLGRDAGRVPSAESRHEAPGVNRERMCR